MITKFRSTIEVNGEKRTLNFGMQMWEDFCEAKGIDLPGLADNLSAGFTSKDVKLVIKCAANSEVYLSQKGEEMSDIDVARFYNDEPVLVGELMKGAVAAYIGVDVDKLHEVIEKEGEKSKGKEQKKSSRSVKSKK